MILNPGTNGKTGEDQYQKTGGGDNQEMHDRLENSSQVMNCSTAVPKGWIEDNGRAPGNGKMQFMNIYGWILLAILRVEIV
jgi:hypothetical protein